MKPIWQDAAWVGLLAFLSVCLVATSIWENGDIELKWLAVKAWANGEFPAFSPNHHNLRWAITLPAVAWVRVVGDGALSYLLLNHVVFALTSALLYALVRQLTTPLVAALTLGLWLVNPVIYSLPSNLMPEIYSMIYPVAALLFIRNAYDTGSRWSFAWAVVMMFLAYGAKETNIFFMPGWGLYELWRRRWINVGLICGVFGGLLLIETVALNVILSESNLLLGRAQAIIEAGHLDEMTTDWIYRPIDLILRWGFIAETNFDRLEYFPKAIYLALFGLSAWKAWTWMRARTWLPPANGVGPEDVRGGEAISIAWAMGLSFAFCTTFFILSLDPLILGQPLNDRYLWPLLIPAYVVLAAAVQAWLKRAEAKPAGVSGVATRITRAAEPLVSGRAGLAALLVIAGFATLARWPIELGAIHIRRQGFDQPYTLVEAQGYFDQARARLMDGCTLVFSRPRPAQTMLVHAFGHGDIQPLLRLYAEDLDGLTLDGQPVRFWPLPDSERALFEGKLYAELDNPDFFRPHALRLEAGGACEQTFYYGQADIAPRDQTIEGHVSAPPPRS